MKLVRVEDQGIASWGAVHGDDVQLMAGDIFTGATKTAFSAPLKRLKLLPPVVPSKIIGIGLNYKLHVAESPFPVPEVPLLFFKPPTSLIGHLDQIILPDADNVAYEGELGIVIGKRARNVTESEAMDYLFGCTIVNDVSARDYRRQDKASFDRSKGVDTFCPVGPCLVTGLDPDNLKLETRLNGNVVQSSNTNDLLFGIARLISFTSKYMTLLPGDLIATGTPSGVGPLSKGDIIEIEIENIGILTNSVS